ncbi:MAG: hypothetical protein WAU58_07710 [Terriglobales bacterium]
MDDLDLKARELKEKFPGCKAVIDREVASIRQDDSLSSMADMIYVLIDHVKLDRCSKKTVPFRSGKRSSKG